MWLRVGSSGNELPHSIKGKEFIDQLAAVSFSTWTAVRGACFSFSHSYQVN
jgi:hypothetical protein